MTNRAPQLGDRSSDRLPATRHETHQSVNVETDRRQSFLNTETRVGYDDLGKTRFVHSLAMGGDFNPMKIAAVCIGTTATFTLVAAILAVTRQPGASVAALALNLVPLLASIYLAAYEIQTRRIEAGAAITKTDS
ncbi:hypothetical protein [Actinoplanes sp. M2I2]|uniref:hypothetical protein n=1 Tax=Actinoplanes sp. M2I2 TaxID=1734444 RepID=UPI002020E519|nr:hypothetical protein [Actinoplanes sp. M2I2]